MNDPGKKQEPCLHTVYTVGYHSPGAMEKVSELVEAGAVLIDIRKKPTSRHPQWRYKALQRRFSCLNYEHLECLGNVNYRTPHRPFQLDDAEQGMLKLTNSLECRPVILLCGCPEPSHCHRSLVCRLLKERYPKVRIIHLIARPSIVEAWEERVEEGQA